MTHLGQNVQKRLESINGVGEVLIFGGRRREIQVSIDPDRLRAYNLSATDVARRCARRTSSCPAAGSRRATARSRCARSAGSSSPKQFADIVIETRGNSPIRIRDIGAVEDAGVEPRPRLDAERHAGGHGGRPQADRASTPWRWPTPSRSGWPRSSRCCRPTSRSSLVRDQSEFIKPSLAAIEEHLVLGGILAALVVFVFLWNFRSTIIAALAIPMSIIGAFALIAALGYTLNQMTMLALTLMVGIVIDDAIVVLENIYRFVEEKGMSPFEAAIEGTREIGLAVMATTLSLLAVFVPVGFMGGIVGRFMSSFGLTSAAAIAISLIVSFTLTPMLAARWIKPAAGRRRRPRRRRRLEPWVLPAHRPRLHADAALVDGAPLVIVGICVLVVLSIVPLSAMPASTSSPRKTSRSSRSRCARRRDRASPRRSR